MQEAESLFQPPDLEDGVVASAWPHRPAYWRPRHHHAELELNVVRGGRAVIGIGPRRYAVSAGDVVWFLPGIDHVLCEASPDYAMWVVAFRQDLVDRVRTGRPVDPLAGIPEAPAPARLPEAVAAEIDGRCAAVHRGDDWRGEQLADVLVLASGCGPIETPAGWHPCVHRAAALLRADPGLGRHELGEATRTGTSVLAHRFRRALGVSIPEYRARVRLHAVMAALRAGERSLAQAASQSGFGSYAQFHRVVRSMTGLAPHQLVSPEGRALLSARTALRGGLD
jgi:AraC-like DNA-binding protein